MCAAYTGSGAACFEGDLSELDDDFAVALAPGACATCGYGEDAPSGGLDDWFDCITCANAGEEIIVLFDDCTGTCVDAAGKAVWEGLGYADLDDSACEATRACYDDDNFVDSLALGGTNTKYGDDGSYSYSYDDDAAAPAPAPTPRPTNAAALGSDAAAARGPLLATAVLGAAAAAL